MHLSFKKKKHNLKLNLSTQCHWSCKSIIWKIFRAFFISTYTFMITMWGFSQSWEITDLVPVEHGPLVPCDFPSLLLLWYLRLRKGIPGFQAQAIRRCPVKEGDDNILQEEHSPYLTVSDWGENACGSMFPNGLFAVEGDPAGVQMGKWIHRDENKNLIQIELRESNTRLFIVCIFKTRYNFEKDSRQQSFLFQVSR